MLGGPFAAAVAASAIMKTKVADGTVQQVPADSPALKDVATDQDGLPSMPDLQFFMFNLVALGYFAVALARHPTELPQIPSTLVALTGLSALTYVGAKAGAGTPPAISAVMITTVPSNGNLHYGDNVEIIGNGFETHATTATAAVEHSTRLAILFGNVAAPPKGKPGDGNVTDTRVVVTVPDGLAPPSGRAQIGISVLTAACVATQPFTGLYVEAPTITNVIRKGKIVEILGYGFGPDSSARTVIISSGGTVLESDSNDSTSTRLVYVLASDPRTKVDVAITAGRTALGGTSDK